MSAGEERPRATRLTLLCRGATESNRLSRLSSDEPLLDGEAERASRLARLLPYDTFYSAPEASARQTAAAFSAHPAACEPLRDADYGAWAGRTIGEIAPDELQAWLMDPSGAPHGGESFEAVRGRCVRWLDGLHGAGGRHLAVTHAIVLKVLLAHVLDAPLSSVWRIDAGPLSMLALTSDGRRWALRAFGDPDGLNLPRGQCVGGD